MKVTSISVLALCASAASAASSLNVASVISDFYPQSTPVINAKASTSLASALYSVQSTWEDSAAYTSAHNAIFSAAPSSVQASLSASGYEYRAITSQSWYTKNVPKAQQTAIAKEVSAIDSAADKILAKATSTSKGAAKRTAVPMVMGAVGVMGGLMAAM